MTMSDNVADDGGQAQPGAWVELREACRQLGLTERSLYRRIRAGKLHSRRALSGRTEVFLPLMDGMTSSDVVADVVGPASPDRQIAILERFGETIRALVEPLQHDLREAREQIMWLARENGQLSERNKQLEAALAALEAGPKLSDAVSDDDSQMSEPMSNEPRPAAEAVSRPATGLWARLRGWIGS
jgi:uncharacterized protein with von Willebrand factor type A (vWA) domain